ncbi:MAG: DMT family transporter [Pseudomonadota bacterium]
MTANAELPLASENRGAGVMDYFLIGLLSLIFGSSFMFTKWSVAEVGPLTVATTRLFIGAAIVLLAAFAARQSLPRAGAIWFWIALSALFGNALPFALISWGQVQVDAGLTAILMAIMPLATLALAHFFTADERFGIWKLIGMVLGLLGVIVLMGFETLSSLGDQSLRQYAILGAALCYAVNAVITKKLVGLPRRATAGSLLLVAGIMVLPFAALAEAGSFAAPGGLAIISMIVLGIAPTAFGTLLLFQIIDRQGATFLSQINFLVPVFGVMFSILFLSEKLPANAFVALTMILIGVALTRLSPTALSVNRA